MSGGETRLTILNGEGSGTSHSLGEQAVLLGRGVDCDMALSDNYASRHHCWIEPRGDNWWVRDLGSKNGTLVGASRIAGERRLADGDVVTVGRTQIRFVDPAATRSYEAVAGANAHRIEVNEPARSVRINDVLLEPPLSPKQWQLLLLLWERYGEAVSKDMIAAAVWPEAEGAIYDYQIDKLVSRLRARLGEPGEQMIETIWGFGYKLS